VRFLRTFGLAVVLFPVGLATHEMMHLVVYSALGVRCALLVTSWKLGTLGVTIFGLHSAPVAPAPLPLRVLLINNGLGPLLAAALLLVLFLAVDRRSRVVRSALLANLLVLVFFSSIELTYPLLEDVGHVDADVLLLPELNYGIVLVIMLATAFAATRRRGGGSPSRALPGPRRQVPAPRPAP
jgi:hypothetical protein